MAKYDGVKGYLLLEIEKKPEEVTLVFRDNRFVFVTSDAADLVADDDGVEGAELETVIEGAGSMEFKFRNGKSLRVKSQSGRLQSDSIPE
ncbi:MAG: hypothetical protein QW767_05730 [Thermoprotei archaeon]